jgi:predicted ABC-class ATPase
MRTLHQTLLRIDGKGYKAYKDIQGTYQDTRFRLHIDYVQGDPFASPSRIRLEAPRLETRIVEEWTHTALRTTAVEDFLARQMSRAIGQQKGLRAGTGKSGMIAIDTPGQEVLNRTAVRVTEKHVEFRLSVGLPAQGRRILGRQAADMLVERLPRILDQAMDQWDEQKLIDHMQLSDQQDAIRRYLQDNGYVSFIANGAVLPRESGISNRPLQG